MVQHWIDGGVPLWQVARSRGRHPISWPYMVLLTLLLGMTAVAVTLRPQGVAWWQGLAIVILAPLGGRLMAGVLQACKAWTVMRSPAQLALVPGMAAHMRGAAARALGLSLLPWLILAAAFPAWLGVALAMISYTYAIVLVTMARGPRMVWWMGILIALPQIVPRLIGGGHATPLIVLPAALLCVCLAWGSFEQMFSLKVADAQAPSGPAAPRRTSLHSRGFERTLRQRRLLMPVFGAGLFSLTLWIWLLIIGTGALVLEMVVVPRNPAMAVLRFLIVAMPVALLVARAASMVAALRRRTAEQALFKLAPAAPRAPALNRVLARQLLRMGAADWPMTSVCVLGWSLLIGLGLRGLVLMAALMLCVLPLLAWPLRDYARDSGQAALPVIGVMCVQLLLVAVAAGLWPRPVFWLVHLLLAGLAAAVIALRYRRMAGAPVAFPARRMHSGKAA